MNSFGQDRFKANGIQHAVDAPPELLAKAPPDVVALPLLGPALLSLRPLRDGNEKMEAEVLAFMPLDSFLCIKSACSPCLYCANSYKINS